MRGGRGGVLCVLRVLCVVRVLRVEAREAAPARAAGSGRLALVVAGLAGGGRARLGGPQAGVAGLLRQQRLLRLDHRVEQALLYLCTKTWNN